MSAEHVTPDPGIPGRCPVCRAATQGDSCDCEAVADPELEPCLCCGELIPVMGPDTCLRCLEEVSP